jgi:hypothetical protein
MSIYISNHEKLLPACVSTCTLLIPDCSGLESNRGLFRLPSWPLLQTIDSTFLPSSFSNIINFLGQLRSSMLFLCSLPCIVSWELSLFFILSIVPSILPFKQFYILLCILSSLAFKVSFISLPIFFFIFFMISASALTILRQPALCPYSLH